MRPIPQASGPVSKIGELCAKAQADEDENLGETRGLPPNAQSRSKRKSSTINDRPTTCEVIPVREANIQ